ncbi:MAG: DUF3298 domain-containing protein [Alphaproteobacteria bacterium]|nr:DUF3298 domain-containing protein [Alphaproteobacteria bacterium]
MAGRVRGLVLVAALAFAVTGCGRQGGEESASGAPSGGAGSGAGAPAASIEAQLDPCADKAGLAQKVCQDPALAAAAGEIKAKLAEAAGAVSAEGDKLIVDGQKAWLETQAASCGVAANAPDAAQCLKTALAQRLEDAKTAVEQKGGFTFQRVEINAAQPVTAEVAAASGLGENAPPAVTRELSYPRIDGVASAAAQKFNAIMAKMGQPRFKLEDATTETSEYKITFASPKLVSVQFLTSDYSLGAAHPNNGMTAVTVLMDEGREITAEDIFKPGSGWELYLTRRSMRGLTKTFAEFGAGPPELTDVRDTATKAHNWTVTDDGLVVLFPPYSVGPFALGGQEVKIPWKDLQPYVNPNAPPPITQPKPS